MSKRVRWTKVNEEVKETAKSFTLQSGENSKLLINLRTLSFSVKDNTNGRTLYESGAYKSYQTMLKAARNWLMQNGIALEKESRNRKSV
jgi:hypothetical protein